MIFFVNETYHFAIRLKEVGEAEELAKSFASGHKIYTVETEKELVNNMFQYIRFKKANRLTPWPRPRWWRLWWKASKLLPPLLPAMGQMVSNLYHVLNERASAI